MVNQTLSSAARLPLSVYRALFPLVFAVMLPGFVSRIVRRGNYRHKFGQRFGRYTHEDRRTLESGNGHWTWIHAVSVGEMVMALNLARAMQEADPRLRILLSTTTSTGFALAREKIVHLPQPVELIYYPIDLAGIVRRVLDIIRPARLVLVDKELWPNMVTECHRRSIPISIVNARLSPKSERGFLKWRRWVAPFFGMLENVCVQEPDEIARWHALGVRKEALVCTGSLKFDFAVQENTRASEFRALLETLGIAFTPAGDHALDPILLGGSTFPGEEAALGRILLSLRARWPRMTLIVVPRHVERTSEVQTDLQTLGLQTVLRSELPSPARQTTPTTAPAGSPSPSKPDVIIVDTTGELRDWYAVATLCFIGKSLCAKGGQNPAEPLLAGRPVLFGPNMTNFTALIQQLLTADGATQVQNEEQLAAAAARLLSDPDMADQQVQKGRQVLRTHEGATLRITQRILSQPFEQNQPAKIF
jgi:3-deoxy-D-manno-octulosonic-acid transferase